MYRTVRNLSRDKRSKIVLVAKVFLFLILSAGIVRFCYAGDLSKMAPDLREEILKNSDSGRAASEGLSGGEKTLLSDSEAETLNRPERYIIRYKDRIKSADHRDIEELGGIVNEEYSELPFVAATLSLDGVIELSDERDVAWISPDRPVAYSSVPDHSFIQGATGMTGVTSYEGEGITVAIVDSGLYTASEDFFTESSVSRIIHYSNYTNESENADNHGHGTHVAGIAGGNGTSARAYEKNLTGIAPKCNLAGFKVLKGNGRGYSSWVLSALDDILVNHEVYNIKVVNMSLSGRPCESYKTDPLCLAVKDLVQSGIVVVCSAGNRGRGLFGGKVYGSIGNPGISPYAVTVGACNPHGTEYLSDDTIARFSSRGPTRGYDFNEHVFDNCIKPDITAPGCHIVSVSSLINSLLNKYPFLLHKLDAGGMLKRYLKLSGTSMSAPIVAGAAALLYEANPALTPQMIKAIMMYTAYLIPDTSAYEQGAGILNLEGAVRLAEAIKPDVQDPSEYEGYYDTVDFGINLFQSAVPSPTSSIGGESFSWAAGKTYVYDSGSWELVGGALFLDDLLLTPDGIYFIEALQFADDIVFGASLTGGGDTAILWSDNSLIDAANADNWSGGYLAVSSAWQQTAALGQGDILEGANVANPAILWSDGIFWSDSTLGGSPAILWSDGIIADTSLNEELFLLGDNVEAEGDYFEYEEE